MKYIYIKTSNGSGTLILAELNLTFDMNTNISALPLLFLELAIFDKCPNTLSISKWTHLIFRTYFWVNWKSKEDFLE